jgi:hypothetical protein
MPRWDAIGFFCEDIRQEVNGVETIIGVMPDNVIVEGGTTKGGFLPKLGMYVRIHVTPDIDVESISASVDFFEGEHRQLLGTFSRNQIEKEKEGARSTGALLIGFITKALLTPFPVPRIGPVRLKAKVGEEEIVCGGIRFVDATSISSNAPPQQAETASPSNRGSSN